MDDFISRGGKRLICHVKNLTLQLLEVTADSYHVAIIVLTEMIVS